MANQAVDSLGSLLRRRLTIDQQNISLGNGFSLAVRTADTEARPGSCPSMDSSARMSPKTGTDEGVGLSSTRVTAGLHPATPIASSSSSFQRCKPGSALSGKRDTRESMTPSRLSPHPSLRLAEAPSRLTRRAQHLPHPAARTPFP
jgi:hypothetical protein